VPLGRWPANLIHDGSDEVVAAFPETTSGQLLTHHKRSGKAKLGTFDIRDRTGEECNFGGDTGSAARFFYSARPDHRCALCDALIAEASSPTESIQTENSVRPDAPVSPIARQRGQRESVERLCEQCGEAFRAMPSADMRLCSRECAALAARKDRPKCEVCGDPVRLMRNRYCSRACRGKAAPKRWDHFSFRVLSPSTTLKSCGGTLRCMWQAGKTPTPF
jgi:hypothetical protein